MGIFGFAKQILALFLTDQVAASKTIYVRSSGNDTTGNGSLASPYRTVNRAAADVPDQWVGADYTIDCTGLADTETAISIKKKRARSGSLTLRADRTILDTIATADLTLGTPNARTQKIVLTVAPSPGWTVNAFQGKLITEIGGSVDGAQIVANTADTLTVIGGFFTGGLDCQIEDYGAEFTGPVAGGAALTLEDLDCAVTVANIKLNLGTDVALKAQECDDVTLQSVSSIGLDLILNDELNVNSCFFGAGQDLNYDFSGNSLFFGCFFYVLNPASFIDTMQGGTVHLLYCYSYACGSFPRYDNSILRPNHFGTFYAQGCEFDSSYRRAVYAYGGGYTKIQDCVITNAVTGGVQALANARLHCVNTIGNITSALATSIGLYADTGADFKVDTTSLITVAGAALEVKVGDRPGQTKATFNALPARTGEIDLVSSLITGLAVGTRAHMHQ